MRVPLFVESFRGSLWPEMIMEHADHRKHRAAYRRKIGHLKRRLAWLK